MDERVVVSAAVIRRGDEFLVTRRLKGTHLEGYWEFPGGKCEDGESHVQCLEREIREELDTGIRVGELILTTMHSYPGRVVELHFFRCELDGDPRPAIGQEMRWVASSELGRLNFPPADSELLDVLKSGR